MVMSFPGFTAWGSRSQAERFCPVFGRMAPANVVRLPKCVRSGPMFPPSPSTPVIVWHAPHPTCCSAAMASPLGGVPGWCCCWTHESKSVVGWAMTRNRMLAWEVPQYSAHCPRNTPA